MLAADVATQGASSAYAALKRFWEGQWLASDVETVIAYAMATVSANEVKVRPANAMLAKMGMPMPETFVRVNLGDPMPAIVQEGHAAFVELCEVILRACLFGIEDVETEFQKSVGDDAN